MTPPKLQLNCQVQANLILTYFLLYQENCPKGQGEQNQLQRLARKTQVYGKEVIKIPFNKTWSFHLYTHLCRYFCK